MASNLRPISFQAYIQMPVLSLKNAT